MNEEAKPKLPDFIRRRIEEAIRVAVNPPGMSVHDGKARVHSSDLSYMLHLIDYYEKTNGVNK
jgi:hypothetical protein